MTACTGVSTQQQPRDKQGSHENCEAGDLENSCARADSRYCYGASFEQRRRVTGSKIADCYIAASATSKMIHVSSQCRSTSRGAPARQNVASIGLPGTLPTRSDIIFFPGFLDARMGHFSPLGQFPQ